MSRVLSAGDNGGITENVFFEHVRAMEEIQKRKMKLMADEKAAKKLAKEDGIDLEDLKTVQRERAMSLAEQIASHNRKTQYQRFFKMPIGQHINIVDENFSDETGLTDEEREAKWVGFGQVAGLEGKSLNEVLSGHDPNADTGRWITTGWEKGQATLGSKIRQKKADPAPEKKADSKPAAAATTQPEKAEAPKSEPEADQAKRRGRPPKNGVTYWHNPELKKVFEVSSADAPPKDAVSITKPEYEKLSHEYAKAAEDDWDQASPSKDETPPAPGSEADDDWNTPPAPSA